MTIAELFVELSIKGSEKTVQGFKNIRNGLGDIKSMSLETKAAILGALYGLEKMMSQSAQLGTGLTNFTALTGLSSKMLQQWTYAARQAGVSGDEFTSSLKSVQSNITTMLAGGGAPKGLGLISNAVGLDPKRLQDTFYLMEKLQEFAQKNRSALGTDALKSMGLSEGTIAAMRRNVFTQNNFKKAPTYSEGEIRQLDRVNVAWSNLGQKIQMAFGHLTSKHGMQLVGDISKITDQVLKLANAFLKLAEQLQFFKGIAKVFEGWAALFDVTTSQVKNFTKQVGEKGVAQGSLEHLKDMVSNVAEAGKGAYLTLQESMPSTTGSSSTNNNNVTVNQTLNFQHDGKDHGKTSESVHKAVQKAFRQNSALKGGY